MNDQVDRSKKFPVFALLLGFLPAALLLAVAAIDKFENPSSSLLSLGAVGTLVCCFGASFQLFRHRTALAVTGGILFLLLNGAMTARITVKTVIASSEW